MSVFFQIGVSHFQMSGSTEVSAFPDGDNIFKWIGTVKGPKGTVSIVIQFII